MSHLQRARVALQSRAVALVVCLGVHAAGCAEVDGGAVELSWKLRAATGSEETFLDCRPKNAGVIKAIRLDWDVEGEQGHRQWPCDDDHGVTKFELPEGTALLRVSPVCASVDATLDTYTAPAPEQREVIAGDTISLGGVELLLEVSSCPTAPCICR
jgi:hypothetical protein